MVKTNKMAEAIARFEAGESVMVVEYRVSKADKISWRDKAGSGKVLEAETLRHTVETPSGAFAVDERLPDKVTGAERLAELQKGGLTKGKKVLLVLTQLITQKGVTSARGSIELLT